MSTETEYTNCISLEQMEYLDLFDKLPYKVVKKIVKMDDDTEFEVEIKDLPHDDYNKRFTSFKFTLEIDISQGSLPLMVEKHYCVIKEYDGSSPMAMFIDENLTIEVEESSDEEEEEHECELCKKHVQETEYLPSKEDEEKQQILGNDYCLECYKKVEKFEFVENIDLDK